MIFVKIKDECLKDCVAGTCGDECHNNVPQRRYYGGVDQCSCRNIVIACGNGVWRNDVVIHRFW